MRLTFGFWQPYQECVSVVDESDDGGDQDDKNVADDHLRPYWQSARHSFRKLLFDEVVAL